MIEKSTIHSYNLSNKAFNDENFNNLKLVVCKINKRYEIRQEKNNKTKKYIKVLALSLFTMIDVHLQWSEI